jgi:hypothetical protein
MGTAAWPSCATRAAATQAGRMTIIGCTMGKLAALLGVGEHQADDAVRSERAAKAALSRRNLLASAAALASGMVFGDVIKTSGFVMRLSGATWTIAGTVYDLDGALLTYTKGAGGTLRWTMMGPLLQPKWVPVATPLEERSKAET